MINGPDLLLLFCEWFFGLQIDEGPGSVAGIAVSQTV